MDRYFEPGQEIEPEHLTEFLQRQNNLLESLVRIFKQFIQLNSSQKGRIELNKKLCIVECLKSYVEHLILFHKFELLLPPKLNIVAESELEDKMPTATNKNKNYLSEMEVNFKIIKNRWLNRRKSQMNNCAMLDKTDEIDRKYPFTYMIDCLIEECKLNSKIAKFLSQIKKSFFESDSETKNVYPPVSINVKRFTTKFNVKIYYSKIQIFLGNVRNLLRN